MDDADRHKLLICRLTHSTLLLGWLALPHRSRIRARAVWVDRWDRHRVLVVTQVLAMLRSFALAALALAGRITVLDVLLLSVFQDLINAFDMPARQAFVVQMVEEPPGLPSLFGIIRASASVFGVEFRGSAGASGP